MGSRSKMIPTSPAARQRTSRADMVTEALTLLAESRGIVLSQPRLELYLEDLADLPLEPLLQAIERWRREGSPFFPQVPELRALVNPQPNEDAEAEAAWMQIERFVSRHYHADLGIHGIHCGGTYQAPPPLDRRIETAMRAVGGPGRVWWAINQEIDQSDYGWIKKEFVAAWKRAPAVERHLLDDGELLKKLSEGGSNEEP
jgi:hypothetical protein